MNLKKVLIIISLPFLANNLLFSQNKNINYSSGKSDTIDVLHYNIHIDIMNFPNKTINGYTDLKITPKLNSVSSIPLDLLQLTVDSIFIDDNKIPSFNYNDTLLRIPLTNSINIGDTITTRVYYHGEPQVESYGWGGFHFSNSIAYNLGIALEANPHNYGKVWFPCIDDFVDRATYDFYITTENDKIAVCNGTLIGQNYNRDSTITYHWNLKNTIPTYLASVAVSNYVSIKDTFNGINGKIPISIYVRPSYVSNVQGSFIHLKDILSIYEQHWGAYPWERVGYVGTTLGSMEHATNIAYPNSCITGDLTYEWLYAHELSHHWFGDKYTCSTEGDMWLNEGWAVYNESLFREGLYGEKAYKDNVRKKHEHVLRLAHIIDNGYRALSPMPHEYTYGETVYQKGAGVVHTLRGYLGDSLFFNTIKAFLNEFAYQAVSSYDLRNFISSYTGIDMTDFFDGYVFAPGFPHFSVDSFAVSAHGQNYNVTVYVRQRLKGAAEFYNSNKVEVTFMNNNWNTYNDIINFSGQYGTKVFQVPFSPDIVMLDLGEKICDATTDLSQVIKTTGTYNFPQTYCKLIVHQINDSAFVRVVQNWVAPDSLKTPVQGLRLSNNRYWKIDGIFPPDFVATGQFFYSKSYHLDDSLFSNTGDSLVMLYRQNTAADWQPINFRKSGGITIGYIFIDTLQKGEYTLSVWDKNYVGNKKNKNYKKNSLRVYPNPSDDSFNIEFNIKNKAVISVYNSQGELVDNINILPKQNFVQWKPINLSKGIYFIRVHSKNNKVIANKKIVYVK